MSTAGYGMKFGKGYLGPNSGGGKDMAPKGEPAGEEHQEGSDEGDSHHQAIHQHLQAMHEATGHGHSHIEHKPEGHMAHHIDHEGQMSGPEPTEDCPGGMCGGGQGMM